MLSPFARLSLSTYATSMATLALRILLFTSPIVHVVYILARLLISVLLRFGTCVALQRVGQPLVIETPTLFSTTVRICIIMNQHTPRGTTIVTYKLRDRCEEVNKVCWDGRECECEEAQRPGSDEGLDGDR